MNIVNSASARERRLIAKGDLGQLGRDLKDFHIRADDPLAAAGSVVMAPIVGFTKIGNALVGQLSSVPAEPLGDGAFKYTARDIQSIGSNVGAAVSNLFRHPVRALGNVAKAGFDVADLLVDPLLDIGSGLFGHQHRVRHSLQKTLAA